MVSIVIQSGSAMIRKPKSQGSGPIFVDVRHLKPKELEHLFFTLGIDKDTLPDFLMKKGYNLEGTMIALVVSEPMQARPSELCGSGIKIDENCMSNIPGIFAAGDASDQMGCLHMCVAGGYAAGKSAAEYAGLPTAGREGTIRRAQADLCAHCAQERHELRRV